MGRVILEGVVPIWLLVAGSVAGWEALAFTDGAKRRKRVRLAKKADKASRKGRHYLADQYDKQIKELEK